MIRQSAVTESIDVLHLNADLVDFNGRPLSIEAAEVGDRPGVVVDVWNGTGRHRVVSVWLEAAGVDTLVAALRGELRTAVRSHVEREIR